MHRVARFGPAFACLFLLTACPSDQPPFGSGSGELGRGNLFIACTPKDAACEPEATELDGSTPIALGASFFVRYDGQVPLSPTGGPAKMILFSSSPDMLSKDDDDQFVSWVPGHVAVIARTEQGTVTEFVHLRIAGIDRIQLDGDPSGATMTVGTQGVWLASPLSVDGTVLGGTLGYVWEVEGSAIEIVAQDGREVTLAAREAGSAIVRARAGEATGEATVSVEGP